MADAVLSPVNMLVYHMYHRVVFIHLSVWSLHWSKILASKACTFQNNKLTNQFDQIMCICQLMLVAASV